MNAYWGWQEVYMLGIIPTMFKIKRRQIIGVHTVCYAFLGFLKFTMYAPNRNSDRKKLLPGWNFSLVGWHNTKCGPRYCSSRKIKDISC